MSVIAIKIKKVAEKAVLQGHPWVYESSIEKQNKEGKTGDIVIIFDQRRNQFLAIGLYDGESPIRVKILHQGSPMKLDLPFFRSRLKDSLLKRQDLLKTNTTAFRLVFGENDGFPGLIIDVYNENVVIKLYSGIWVNYLDWVKEVLIEILEVKSIILRLNRQLQKENQSLINGSIIFGELKNEEVEFKEHGLTFCANLIKGHKTGYFLDHRHNRLKIRSLSKNKDVLDVFSYAGGFTVNALKGGAKSVASLDISEQALEIAKSNVSLNFNKANHTTLAKDAFEGIKQLQSQQKMFELIIVDPPSFAKSEDQINKAIHSYRKLLKTVLPILSKGGILLMASCSSRVKKEDFFNLVKDELGKAGKKYKVITTTEHDIDHPIKIPELTYLKSIYIQVF